MFKPFYELPVFYNELTLQKKKENEDYIGSIGVGGFGSFFDGIVYFI
jgi:hypothetical protein